MRDIDCTLLDVFVCVWPGVRNNLAQLLGPHWAGHENLWSVKKRKLLYIYVCVRLCVCGERKRRAGDSFACSVCYKLLPTFQGLNRCSMALNGNFQKVLAGSMEQAKQRGLVATFYLLLRGQGQLSLPNFVLR